MNEKKLIEIKNKLMKCNLIEECKIDELLKSMKNWKNGEYIYPSNICEILDSDYILSYNILDLIRDEGALNYRFILHCHKCNKEIKRLESLNKFPKTICCENNHELTPLEDTVVTYQMVV